MLAFSGKQHVAKSLKKKSSLQALKILQLQRAMLLLGGPDLKWDPKIHDANPPRFYEPLPSAPYKGKTVNRAKGEEEKRRQYEAVEWDKNGIPKTETLRTLKLEDVDKCLEHCANEANA